MVFRYVSLTTPVLLLPGSYVIGAYYETISDYAVTDAGQITNAPEVTYGQGRFGFGNTLPSVPTGGEFGPNFQFAGPTNGMPDGGGTFLLLGAALIPPRPLPVSDSPALF